jgi:energy-coupling factor transport system ATP-binding protein
MTAAGARLRGFGWRPLGRRDRTISDLDLTIEAGERVLIAGPSGSGKSTLLNALAGALGTTIAGEQTGEVEVDGRIGLLMQNPGDAVVAERIGRDIAFGPENLGLPRDEIARRVGEAIDAVDLPYGPDHLTAALSGGELQRLALAGVLAMRPQIFLLDEPTSMLDDHHARSVREAIVSVSAGATLLVVEHHVGPWLEHVDRVVVLSRAGEVVRDCGPSELRADDPELDGIWLPGRPPPEPLAVPHQLVAPTTEPMDVVADGLSIELVARTLRGTERTLALRGFDGAVSPACVTAFTGPSGAGKSTALAAFGGLLSPQTGTLTPALHSWRSRRLARTVGWVPQNPEHGFLTQSVGDEVVKTADRLGVTVDVPAVLAVFGLEHLAGANPYRLSGGEQRRLALVAALAHRPGVVLLDEPTVGQDRHTWAAVVGWFAAAAASGAAVALATHDPLVPWDTEHRLEAGVRT